MPVMEDELDGGLAAAVTATVARFGVGRGDLGDVQRRAGRIRRRRRVGRGAVVLGILAIAGLAVAAVPDDPQADVRLAAGSTPYLVPARLPAGLTFRGARIPSMAPSAPMYVSGEEAIYRDTAGRRWVTVLAYAFSDRDPAPQPAVGTYRTTRFGDWWQTTGRPAADSLVYLWFQGFTAKQARAAGATIERRGTSRRDYRLRRPGTGMTLVVHGPQRTFPQGATSLDYTGPSPTYLRLDVTPDREGLWPDIVRAHNDAAGARTIRGRKVQLLVSNPAAPRATMSAVWTELSGYTAIVSSEGVPVDDVVAFISSLRQLSEDQWGDYVSPRG